MGVTDGGTGMGGTGGDGGMGVVGWRLQGGRCSMGVGVDVRALRHGFCGTRVMEWVSKSTNEN